MTMTVVGSVCGLLKNKMSIKKNDDLENLRNHMNTTWCRSVELMRNNKEKSYLGAAVTGINVAHVYDDNVHTTRPTCLRRQPSIVRLIIFITS